jgi:hypothetical protein
MRLWTVLGALFSLGFGAFGVYVAFYANQPSILVSIVSEVDVLDLDRDIPHLDILYQGKDVKADEANITIYKIKIENTGTKNIIVNDFDPKISWGIKFDKGNIIDASLISASNEYLKNNIKITHNRSGINFPVVIFEKNDKFVVEVVLLKKAGEASRAIPFGKIVGFEWKSIEKFNEFTEEGLWAKITNGSIIIHILRSFIYFFVFIFSIIPIAIIAAMLSFAFDTIKERRIKKYLDLVSLSDEGKRRYLTQIYVREGVPGLEILKSILSDDAKVREAKKAYDDELESDRMSPRRLSHLTASAMIYSEEALEIDEESAQRKPAEGEQSALYWGPASRDFGKMRDLGLVAGGARGPVKIDEEFKAKLDDIILRLK